MENLDQVTTREEQSDNLCAGSNMPKVNDRIRYRLPGEDWVVAVVTGRGGKANGKNKYYFNICNIDNGGVLGIDLDKAEFQVLTESFSGQGLNEQSCGESTDNVEVVQTVFIPTEHHSDPDVLEAKQKELENWTNFGVYYEIDDQRQRTISTKWVVSKIELSDRLMCVKARLVTRGFEEDEKGPVDSPTASMKIFFSVCANNNWVCETMDIKAAFLQGKEIERDIYVNTTNRGKERRYYLETE